MKSGIDGNRGPTWADAAQGLPRRVIVLQAEAGTQVRHVAARHLPAVVVVFVWKGTIESPEKPVEQLRTQDV